MDAAAVSVSRSQTVLDVVQYAYAPVLLIVFLIAFTIRSIHLSRQATAQAKEEANKIVLGPGGKALPKKKKVNKKSKGKKGGKGKDEDDDKDKVIDFSKPRKRLFEFLSAVVCLTFLASAGNVIGHAIVKREEGWWCGAPPVVRCPLSRTMQQQTDTILVLYCRWSLKLYPPAHHCCRQCSFAHHCTTRNLATCTPLGNHHLRNFIGNIHQSTPRTSSQNYRVLRASS